MGSASTDGGGRLSAAPEAASRTVDTMSGSDALLWTISTDPVMRPTVVAVMILAAAPSWDEVQARVSALTGAVPRLRSCALSRGPGRIRPQFVVDPTFDLDLHLRRVRVAGAGGRRHVLDLAQSMATSGFDHALPLWEAVLIEDLGGGEAAIVMKVHHALIDGVGGLAALGALFDPPEADGASRAAGPDTTVLEPDGDGRDASPPTVHSEDLPESVKIVDEILDTVRHPFRTLGRAAEVGTSVARLMAPAGSPISPIMHGRSARRRVEVVEVPVADLRRAARGWQGTLNDVFVASVVRGLAQYHEQHGVASPGFRVLMPVNVRHPGDRAAGNHFVPARFVIPVHADLADSVAEVQHMTGKWKQAPGLALSDVLAEALSTLPAPAARAVWGAMLMGNDFCITNVPGPPFPVSLDGALVRAIYAVSPPSGAAFNVSLVSLAERACITLTVDTAAVPDSAKLAGCIDDGFAEVCSIRAE